MISADTKPKAKDVEARNLCNRWGMDWGNVEGVPEPRAGQIIRAIALSGWAGWRRNYREVYGFMIRNGSHDTWIRMSRPATITVRPNGKGKSGHGSVDMVNRERAAQLVEKYIRFYRWMTEGRHQWEQIDEIHFADNSIEVVERSRLTGETRQRMTLAPGGDACF